MSLRLRLLAAVGVVALIALIAADVATYSALRAFLYQRVDQSLSTAHVALERQLRANTAPNALNAASFAPGIYVEIRDAQGTTIGQAIPARGFGGKVTTPRL